jgi:hypothetical protein
MKHYICNGECKGVSEKSGYCNAEECSKYKKPLKECNCNEEEHFI